MENEILSYAIKKNLSVVTLYFKNEPVIILNIKYLSDINLKNITKVIYDEEIKLYIKSTVEIDCG